MLLSDTIQKSVDAINKRNRAIDDKEKAETYLKTLVQLDQTVKKIEDIIKCAIEMKSQGIVSNPVLNEQEKEDLLNCISSCGNSLSPNSAERLSMDKVKLLQSKSGAIESKIRVVWKDAANNYAKSPVGYLSAIRELTDNPYQAKVLVSDINNTIGSNPSIKSITKLVTDVAEAKRITNEFSIGPEIEKFLKKVSSQQATVADLTPDVVSWLQEKDLMRKLKVGF